MISDRPYRKGMPGETVERIVREGSGTQWDPKAVEAFFRALPEIKTLRASYQQPASRQRNGAAAGGEETGGRGAGGGKRETAVGDQLSAIGDLAPTPYSLTADR